MGLGMDSKSGQVKVMGFGLGSIKGLKGIGPLGLGRCYHRDGGKEGREFRGQEAEAHSSSNSSRWG